MKTIIIALPNSASETLMHVINQYSNHTCRQIFLYNEIFFYDLRKRVTSHFLKFQFVKGISLFFKHKMFNLINSISPINKLRNTNPSIDFKYLSQIHSDICDFDTKLYRDFNTFLDKHENLILKQHFPPTANNRELFKNFKKIILIRNVDEALNKYTKHPDTKDHYIYLENGLRKDMTNWVDGWSNEKNSIIVEFKNFIQNPNKEIEKIENFSNIKFDLAKDFVLPKKNVTQQRYN